MWKRLGVMMHRLNMSQLWNKNKPKDLKIDWNFKLTSTFHISRCLILSYGCEGFPVGHVFMFYHHFLLTELHVYMFVHVPHVNAFPCVSGRKSRGLTASATDHINRRNLLGYQPGNTLCQYWSAPCWANLSLRQIVFYPRLYNPVQLNTEECVV